MIFTTGTENAKEFNAVKSLYWGLIMRYSHAGLHDILFYNRNLSIKSPLSRFISNFERKIIDKEVIDLDGPTTNTALDVLVDVEKDLSDLEYDIKLLRAEGKIN
ncbi:MAG: hypothetical protein Q7R87_03565 [Nanoarchaeota archaeon]|nr:hypothetical protein [Nanoarchaeota archaeon]